MYDIGQLYKYLPVATMPVIPTTSTIMMDISSCICLVHLGTYEYLVPSYPLSRYHVCMSTVKFYVLLEYD